MEKLIQELIREHYLKTPAIIEAFGAVDRADFIPENKKELAYENIPLPIGRGQTISQPLTVAFMLELLDPRKGERILDIGAGSGWTAALLAHLAGKEGSVMGIERIPELAATARIRAKKYSPAIEIIEADGVKGYPEKAPYDKIIAAAAGDAVPGAWKDQLKIGGRIVAPVRGSVIVLDKIAAHRFKKREFYGFSFVPLVGG